LQRVGRETGATGPRPDQFRLGFAGCAFVAVAMTESGELADDVADLARRQRVWIGGTRNRWQGARRDWDPAAILYRDWLACQESINGVAGIVSFDKGFTLAVIDAAFIAQVAVLVEDKHVRRSLRAVRPRNGLRVAVIEIRKSEVAIRTA